MKPKLNINITKKIFSKDLTTNKAITRNSILRLHLQQYNL